MLALGLDEPIDAVGRRLTFEHPNRERHGTVVGVMEDFHYEPLHRPVRPMVQTNSTPPARAAMSNPAEVLRSE